MNLDKAVFYNGKDLYDHLDRRINGKPESEASILGVDVDLMEAPPELQILVIPDKYSKILMEYLEERNKLDETPSVDGGLLILRNLFGLEVIFSRLTNSIHIY
ncbi:MAG: hypothetical protein WCF28_00825 [Methanobacterium sp.]|uniref:hypothetical protein n=1 Tax=Methanobacterium sp. TaxID=2164 RepID=UPI003C70B389